MTRWRKYTETEEDRVRAEKNIQMFTRKREETKAQVLAARNRMKLRLEQDGWNPSQIAQRLADL